MTWQKNAFPRFEFSHRTRAYNLARMRAEFFDILIIGGGITGAGIAREAALRGYKVALVEKNDFASGASSQSSKLVQGGVRYLENWQLDLVYVASQERRHLLEFAPPLVWPVPVLYPIHSADHYTPERLNLGLWLYDALALFGNTERHQLLTPERLAAELPQVDIPRSLGGARYFEAQTDDARLTLETVRSAHRHGAVIVNHFELEAITRSAGKRVDGVLACDLFTRERIHIRARVVVNATGAWTDQVQALDMPDAEPSLRPTKGVHLLVARQKFPTATAISFTVPSDGRLMYILPRERYTLIGTTDTDYAGSPEEVKAEPADVAYILRAVAEEFPRIQLQPRDVISTYAGLRPLLASNSPDPDAVSRRYRIWVTPSGLVNIAGGTLTTHRAMAEQLVSRVAGILNRQFKIRPAYPSRSARVPLMEPEPGAEELTRAQTEALNSLPAETVEYLGRTYGVRQARILDYVAGNVKLRAPIVDGLPYIWAEVPHAMEQEMALTVSDVMMRRLDLFHQVPDGAVIAARDIAGYMSRLLDWLDPDIDAQVEAYARAVQQNREALRG